MTDDLNALAFGAFMPGVATAEPEAWVADAVASGLESVCLFGDAVGSPGRTRATARALHALSSDLLVALDEESGEVTRVEALSGSSFLSASALGKIDDAGVTQASGRLVGRLLDAVGIDWTLAPVADVNIDPRNPVIGVRSYGSDARCVSEQTAAFIAGLQSGRVIACAKHFPGHGDTHVDSHEDLPVLGAARELLDERELMPFRAAIAVGASSIMTGHLLVPSLDRDALASLSPRISTTLLRHELGFDGVVITDAIEMGAVSGEGRSLMGEAAVAALQAGADVVCLGAEDQAAALSTCVAAVLSAVARGELAESVLRAAGGRRGRMRAARQAIATTADFVADERLVASAAARSLTVSGDPQLAHIGVDVVRIAADPGYAAGETGWGVTQPLQLAEYDVRGVRVEDVSNPAGDRDLVIEMRDAWKDDRVMSALVEVLAKRPDAVVIDVGWPTEPILDARGWIVTRGTGRLSSALAACALTGADPYAAATSILSSIRLENS